MKQKKKKNIALIIVTYNQKDVTKKTLKLLQKQTIIPEIIVIDNFSNDGTKEEIEKKFPEIIVLRTKDNYGSSGGQYIGSRYAYEHGYEWIILSDNDAFPISENLIEELVKQATKNTVTQPWNIDEDYEKRQGFWTLHYCCYNRDIFDRIGFPIFNFFIYGDDVEFLRRLQKNNCNLQKINIVSYTHPMKRTYKPNLLYFTIRNISKVTGVYGTFFEKCAFVFYTINSLLIYKKIGEKDYYIFGLKGLKDFLKNQINNEEIGEKAHIFGDKITLNKCEFIKKFNADFINIDYKSNAVLKFEKNVFGNTKTLNSVKKILQSEYAVQESIVSRESLILSFFATKIICLDEINEKDETVCYYQYQTNSLMYKLIYLMVWNILFLPITIMLITRLIFFTKLKNDDIGLENVLICIE